MQYALLCLSLFLYWVIALWVNLATASQFWKLEYKFGHWNIKDQIVVSQTRIRKMGHKLLLQPLLITIVYCHAYWTIHSLLVYFAHGDPRRQLSQDQFMRNSPSCVPIHASQLCLCPKSNSSWIFPSICGPIDPVEEFKIKRDMKNK